MIESALGGALAENAHDGMNGDRLAIAYLYYAITRPDGGGTQLDQLVSSLSRDVEGLERLYSSAEVTKKIAAISQAARLRRQGRPEYRELLEKEIASATDASSLKELASQAQASGNRDLGVRALERAQATYSDPRHIADLTYLLAEAYFQNREWAKAKACFATYMEEHGKDEARRMEAEFLSGWCDFYPGRYRESAVRFFEFARKYPDSDDAAEATHLALVSCSRYAQSTHVSADQKKEFLLRLIQRFLGTELAKEAHCHLGRLTLNTSKDFAGALHHFEAALQGRRSDEVAFYIGVCEENLGHMDKAGAWYRRVILESKYEMPRKRAISALKTLPPSD
jgi:TolA-binding protein